MAREVRVQMLRPGQLMAERERVPLAFLPLGPLEWHGPHLPFGVDPLNAEAVALRVAQEVGGVVLPTLYLGTERERGPDMLEAIGFSRDDYIVGMDFPANSLPSYYFPEEVLAITVRAYLDLLIRQGYRLVVLMNGHGAENHLVTLQRLAIEYTNSRPVRVVLLMPVPGYATGDWSYAHATVGETSVTQAVAPEAVDLSALPSEGPLRNTDFAIVDDRTFRGEPTADHTVRAEEDPRRASAADGERRLQACVAELAAAAREELAKL
jgi:creatinine amidohydrolase